MKTIPTVFPTTIAELRAENARLRQELALAAEAADYALWFATFHQVASRRLQEAHDATTDTMLKRRITELLEKRPV